MEKGSTEREECEKQNCIEILVPRDPKDLEDEYDYSYGYDDDEDIAGFLGKNFGLFHAPNIEWLIIF